MSIKDKLPSRKFTLFIIGCAVGVLAIVFLTSRYGSRAMFRKDSLSPESNTATVGDVMSRDSNGNGIPDWEESLWGLDPKGDGVENKSVIESKKSRAGIVDSATETASSTEEITPTEQFSRSLLATILALKQDGSLDENTVMSVADSLGQSIDQKRRTEPFYTDADFAKVIADTPANTAAYDTAMKKLGAKYQKTAIGTEYEHVLEAVSTESADSLAKLGPIIDAYNAFAKELLALPTPQGAVVYALPLANASAGMADGLKQTTVLYTDAFTGMVGLDEYVSSDEAFTVAAGDMTRYLASIRK